MVVATVVETAVVAGHGGCGHGGSGPRWLPATVVAGHDGCGHGGRPVAPPCVPVNLFKVVDYFLIHLCKFTVYPDYSVICYYLLLSISGICCYHSFCYLLLPNETF